MLVVEKVFGIEIKDDSKKEDLCRKLSECNCFDKENYKINNKIGCGTKCKFFEEKDGRCDLRIYDWLLSECEAEPVVKYRNACGSCKHFEEAEITNKPWRKCPSVYKRGVHAGENRICYQSLNKCCDYVRKEGADHENN